MRLWLLILLASGAVLGASLAFVVLLPSGLLAAPREVAVIPVEGLISATPSASVLGLASSGDITRALREADRDPSVAAVVLRINSPGGTPAAVQEVVTELRRVQKPVIASLGDIAASGAYYIASQARRIYADNDTLTGSIGALWVFQNASSKHAEEGVNFTVIKSGAFKDLGADYRGLTEAEEAYIQQLVNEVTDRFVDAVAAGRRLNRSEVLPLADGRVYSGVAARGFKLVDEIGNFYDAVEGAARLAGVAPPAEAKEVVRRDSPLAPFLTQVRALTESQGSQVLLVPALALG
jgi:protease-4